MARARLRAIQRQLARAQSQRCQIAFATFSVPDLQSGGRLQMAQSERRGDNALNLAGCSRSAENFGVTKRKYVDVNVSWCYGDCSPTAKVPLADWESVCQGKEIHVSTSYWYEGKRYNVSFHFNVPQAGVLSLTGDDGDAPFEDNIKEAKITGGVYSKKEPAPPPTIQVFEVINDTTLSVPGIAEPKTRADVFDVSLEAIKSPDDLISEADQCPPLAWELHRIYSEHREALVRELAEQSPEAKEGRRSRYSVLESKLENLPEEPEDGLAKWAEGIGKKDFSKIRERIRKWFEESPDWGDEEDEYFSDFATGQSAALAIFQDMDPKILDLLGIEIVEGEHPGSSYYAAELNKSIDDANRAAELAGIPIRFTKENEHAKSAN
jgi:hypothetical protein